MTDLPQIPAMLDSTQPQARTDSEPLAEGYYLDNFETVLETVLGQYDDLLKPDERTFAADFAELSLDARRLYVRLISRKGPIFRRDRLDYSEIGDLDAAIERLLNTGFLDEASGASIEELLGVLLRDELLSLAVKLLNGTSLCGRRKPEILACLVDEVDERTLRQMLLAKPSESPWRFVRPLHDGILRVYRMLFFGNLSQDLSAFVLHDLGVMRFEAYELRRELRLFPSRPVFDEALFLREALQRCDEALVAADIGELLKVGREVRDRDEPWDPSVQRLCDRVFHRVGRTLERTGDLDQALEFYAPAARPPSRERQARILDRLDRCTEALELCRDIEADPRDETERLFAPRFAHGLRRRLGEVDTPWRRTRRPTRELVVESKAGTAVETLALHALAESGQTGFFAENWLWKSLFGLYFWDIIFAPLPGAFQHPFQFGPRGLHSAEFFSERCAAIEARLEEIQASRWTVERLFELYQEKQETANAFVAWHDGLALWPSLELVIRRVSGKSLAWVFERLARDPGRYRRGFPDLFVLRGEDPGFELFEVKGPGDQLRPEQKSWIDYLNRGGIPATVLKVRFEDR